MTDIRDARRALVDRLVAGNGVAASNQRRAAFDGAGLTGAMDTLVRKTAQQAHGVSESDIAAARAEGFSEDQVFELMVCAAVGEASRQLDAALAALDAASKEP